MADWKDQLRDVYSKIQKDQKDKKGIKNKFDDVVGYKNKKGFNDTGIPLTPRAAKNLRKNKFSPFIYTSVVAKNQTYPGPK